MSHCKSSHGTPRPPRCCFRGFLYMETGKKDSEGIPWQIWLNWEGKLRFSPGWKLGLRIQQRAQRAMGTHPPPVLSHVYYHGNCLLQAALRNTLFAVSYCPASQAAQWVKNLPAMQETQQTWVRSLDPEDTLDEGVAILQYSCLKSPMDRGAWWSTVHRIAKSQTQLKQLSTHALMMKIINWEKKLILSRRYNWATSLFLLQWWEWAVIWGWWPQTDEGESMGFDPSMLRGSDTGKTQGKCSGPACSYGILW